jgi:hypothetical protein
MSQTAAHLIDDVLPDVPSYAYSDSGWSLHSRTGWGIPLLRPWLWLVIGRSSLDTL